MSSSKFASRSAASVRYAVAATTISLGVVALASAQVVPSVSPIDGGVVADIGPLSGTFTYNWAPSLVEMTNKDLVCLYYGGPGEHNSASGLYYSVKPYGTSDWTAPRVLFNNPSFSEINVTPLATPTGFIGYYQRINNVAYFTGDLSRLTATYDSSARTFSVSGTDVALNGTNGQPLPFSYEPGTAPVKLKNGNLLLGVTDKSNNYTGVVISADNGSTWTYRDIPQNQPTNLTTAKHSMPSVQQLSDGTLVAYTRSWLYSASAGNTLRSSTNPANNVQRELSFTSTSTDGGVTWSTPVQVSALKAPNARLNWVALPDDSRLVAHNNQFRQYDAALGDVYGSETGRHRLDLQLSTNNGATWIDKVIDSNNNNLSDPEIGYPYIISGSDGYQYVAYGYRPTAIKFAKVNKNWFTPNTTRSQLQQNFASLDDAVRDGWTLKSNGNSQNTLFHSNTSNAGGATGEVAGTVRRNSSTGNAMFYADTDLNGTLSTQVSFQATGRFRLQNANWNGDLRVGFFDRTQTLAGKKFVGFNISEPGAGYTGFRVFPLYVNDAGTATGGSPLIPSAGVADGSQVLFTIFYNPATASLTLTLNRASDNALLGSGSISGVLASSAFTLDSFGIVLPGQTAASDFSMNVAFDNFTYTQLTPIPEPAVAALAVGGGAGLLRRRSRRD
jgi:hypothetical protein